MLWPLSRLRRHPKPAKRPARRRGLRPGVEALEERWLLATFTWVGPASGGDFNTPANWQDQNNNQGVPGAGDDAVIPGGDVVTVSQSNTVNSVNGQVVGADLDIEAGTFTLAGGKNSDLSGSTLAAGAALQVNGGTTLLEDGTFAGTLGVAAGGTLSFRHGTIALNAGASLTGTGQYLLGGDPFGPTLTLNTDVTAPANFTFQNGTLNGSGTLTIGGTFTWVTSSNGSATMAGGGTTTVLAGATLNVTGNPTFNTTGLDGRTLNNAGTINISGTGDFVLSSGATLHNLTGGVINIQDDLTVNSGIASTGSVLNEGTVNKTSPFGTGTTAVKVPLNNTATGAVHVQSGTLALSGGGTNLGTLTADANAGVTFPNVFSTYTLNGGSQLTGAGLFDVAGGTVTLAGGASVSNLQLDSGTVNGTGTLTPTAFTWKGGTLAAPTVIPSGDTLAVAGGGSKELDGDLTNNGTVNVTSTADLGIGSTATVTNNGTFNLESDVNLSNLSGSAAFTNAGTLTKSSPGGGGTTGFDPPLTNSGTVDVQSGVLQLTHGGGGTATGVWKAEPGGTLDVHNGTLTLAGGATFTGAGVEQVSFFGNVKVNGAVTAANFTIAGGTLSGTGTFTVTGTLDWTGGSINNAGGTVSIPAGATLLIEGNSNKSLSGGTLNLAGTTTWKDSGDLNTGSGATINNLAGAAFTILNAQTLGGGTFNNAGTLTRGAVPGTTNVSVFNTFTNNGGTINVLGGTLAFNGDLVQSAGTTAVASGATLGVGTFSGSMKLNGGTLTGTGTVSGAVTNSGGTVLPGGASTAGTLTITGKYTQGVAGTLAINVGGTAPGTGFSQLAVGDATSLAGTLSLSGINGFTPVAGNAFPVATFPSGKGTGNLAVGGTLYPGAGNEYITAMGATSFTVADVQIPPAPQPPVYIPPPIIPIIPHKHKRRRRPRHH